MLVDQLDEQIVGQETGVDVEDLYRDAGVLFRTDLENATVRTDAYPVDSPSGCTLAATSREDPRDRTRNWLWGAGALHLKS